MEIVGLSGYARSGKDEAAKILVEEFGFTRVAFADKLREAVLAFDAPVAASKECPGEVIYLSEVIEIYGWDHYKATEFGPEIRRQLQRMGTEVGRNVISDSVWVDAAFAGLPDDAKIVVTDARFENEAQAITARGGLMWRVSRAGVGPAVSPDGSIHSSETSLDDWPFDVLLFNDGSLEAYHDVIRSTYASRL